MNNPPAPVWRLSTFYFVYFISVGSLMPFWGLYLSSRGFSVAEIGQLLAILVATKIVAPNIWGWIADHTGRHMPVIRIASLLACVSYSAVFWDGGFWWLAWVMFSFSFFWNANLPQFEAVTLAHLGKQTQRYSAIRSWGSVGFILAVTVLGAMIEQYGATIVPFVLVSSLALIWMCSMITPEAPSAHVQHAPVSLRDTLKRREVLTLLAVCFLLQASHGPYYAFYSIYLEEHHYTHSVIGGLWALGVVSEIVIFLVMHSLVRYVGAKSLLMWALLIGVLRWWLISAFVENHAVIIFAQTMHAATFGIMHAVAIQYIHRYFPGKLQGRGQALYSSVSFGAGGAVGTLYGGTVWQWGGGAAAFQFSAVMSLIALAIA